MLDPSKRNGPPQTMRVCLYCGIAILYALVMMLLAPRLWWVGLIALLCAGVIMGWGIWSAKRRKSEWDRYVHILFQNIDEVTREAVLRIPIPLVVTEQDGEVLWYNSHFEMVVGRDISGRYIQEFMKDLPLNAQAEKEGTGTKIHLIRYEKRLYRVDLVPVDTGEVSRTVYLIYFMDITDEKEMERIYLDTRPVVVHIQIDNYDEVLGETDEESRPRLIAEAERRISQWCTGLAACWSKYDRDKYIAIIEDKALRLVEDGRFKLLDDIREIRQGNPVPLTLSIGAGTGESSYFENDREAKSALDLALGRGGDQAVVKRGSRLLFYGGKTRAVEKRTKVKSRVIANALRNIMAQSDNMLIMGHQGVDLDALGAALGMASCARYLGLPVYILLNQTNATIDPLLKRIEEEDKAPDLFVSTEEAMGLISPRTLLVIVDTHRPSYVEAPRVLEKAEQVVVIDHHRRSAEQIEHAMLLYQESYASSASELVTEIVQYFGDRLRLTPVEADALLAGITLDTKNFMVKTGVRTFEASAYLRRQGADPANVQLLFREGIEQYSARAALIQSARKIAPGVMLAVSRQEIPGEQVICAQAADGLINLTGVEASFVLCRVQDEVVISARSLGHINVQVILETLGGGGHLTEAGAQLEDVSLDEAVVMIQKAVKKYLEKEDQR
jgi:c-di-AMP phosphodiesterase-like protein